ncbi:MBL fold metallo-hydrolase [Niallia oryzisoli]|uniref:MBL fold metallo-hydrolase n=1 Tax=Niallia oryzisoli TaxID=1737571 RepID=A0ABZ2CBF7_9BACI
MLDLMKKSPPILKEVAKDIYLISIPIPVMEQINCYLFRGEKGFTLIDTGLYTSEGMAIWEDLISSGIKIEKVVLTHFHIDHIGFARWFQEKQQVPVFISSHGYEEMKKRRKGDYSDWAIELFQEHDGLQLFKTAIEEQIAIEEQMMYAYEFEPDGLFDENQYILLGNEIYETIWTPGHSADHFCFYNHERQLMVIGDHIVEHFSPLILLESSTDLNPLMSYYDSLEKMKDYSINLALPGHGNLFENVNKRIEDIQSGHHYRMKQILESLKDEEKTAGQMTQEIYKNASNIAFGPIMSTIIRCIYLESIGKLQSECINGKRLYKKVDGASAK